MLQTAISSYSSYSSLIIIDNQFAYQYITRLLPIMSLKNEQGMDVIEWIPRSDLPQDKTAIYPRYTVACRPKKMTPTEPE